MLLFALVYAGTPGIQLLLMMLSVELSYCIHTLAAGAATVGDDVFVHVFCFATPHADDLLFIWLVLLNEYVTPVPEVANTTKGTDLQSLYCMIKNCGGKIKDCVTDSTCKAGLDCLQGCAFNDQVGQYTRQ